MIKHWEKKDRAEKEDDFLHIMVQYFSLKTNLAKSLGSLKLTLENSTNEIKDTLNKSSDASDRLTRSICNATWAGVGAAIAAVIVTVVGFFVN